MVCRLDRNNRTSNSSRLDGVLIAIKSLSNSSPIRININNVEQIFIFVNADYSNINKFKTYKFDYHAQINHVENQLYHSPRNFWKYFHNLLLDT